MKLSDKDGHAHLRFLVNKQYEEAIELLIAHYKEEDKDFFYGDRKGTINIKNVKPTPKFQLDTTQPLKVRSSFWTWFVFFALLLAITTPFAISDYNSGEGTVGFMTCFWLVLAAPCLYACLDRRDKMCFSPTAVSTSWVKRSTIEWSNVLTAFQHRDNGEAYNYFLIIYKKNTIKPERWYISALEIDSQDISYAFQEYLNAANEKNGV